MSIAERVRGVIADCRLSQAEFAVVSSIEASKLSKSLNGSRRFTSLELAKIAELGKVTVDYLLTGEASPLAMAARKSIDSPAELASRVGTRFAELREVAAHLGAPTRFDPLPHGALVGREIDRAAVLADRAVRRCAERNLNPTADDLATVIEDAFGVDVAVGPLGDNFDGLTASSSSWCLPRPTLDGNASPWRTNSAICSSATIRGCTSTKTSTPSTTPAGSARCARTLLPRRSSCPPTPFNKLPARSGLP
jgi:transcriptional regulator with XRE-family HTH domain